MTILILGSEGFIGRHLVQHFLQQQYEVHGCDLFETAQQGHYSYTKVSRLSPEWEEVFSQQAFDCCINAAGSGNVPYSMTHPLADFEANALDTVRILDAIRRFNPHCRYLHLSSAAVYGNPDNLPIKETDATHPLSPYGWHKLMAEHLCREYFQLFQIQAAIIRPFSVFGNGLRKQLLWDLCNKFQRGNVVLFGTGQESRDFIHVEDLCTLLGCIMEKGSFDSTIYNAATGVETTIREVAGIFENNFPGGQKVSFSGEIKKGDPLNWRADINKMQQIGFKNKVKFEQGVINYINWYCSLAHE